MAIRVQHGVPASPGLAGLAQAQMRIDASRGQSLLQSQGARPAPSRGGGGGGGGSSGFNADLRAFHESNLLEQRQAGELEQLREREALQEQQFDYQYTARQRQKIAQWNNAEQEIMSSQEFSENEKSAALRHIQLQRANMAPQATPIDPNAPQFEPGKEPGKNWVGDDGGVYTTTQAGEPKLMQRYEQTREGIAHAAEIKQRETYDKWIYDLSTEMVTKNEGGVETKTTRNAEEVAEIVLAQERAKELIEKRRAEKQRQRELQDSGESERIYQEGFDRLMGGGNENAWVDEFTKAGIEVREEDAALGSTLGPAQAELRALKSKGNLTGEDAVRANKLIAMLSQADPSAGISDFAIRREPPVKETRGLKGRRSKSSRLAQLGSIGLGGV